MSTLAVKYAYTVAEQLERRDEALARVQQQEPQYAWQFNKVFTHFVSCYAKVDTRTEARAFVYPDHIEIELVNR